MTAPVPLTKGDAMAYDPTAPSDPFKANEDTHKPVAANPVKLKGDNAKYVLISGRKVIVLPPS